jgi:hypothetical protein
LRHVKKSLRNERQHDYHGRHDDALQLKCKAPRGRKYTASEFYQQTSNQISKHWA